MEKRRSYKEEVEKLCKAIDISIESFKTFPPKDWTSDNLNMATSILEKIKQRRLDAEPKFRNLASLKYDIEDLFTYFQEATGDTVEFFWKKINETGLDYKRENKLEKILTRGKIRGRIEYEYVTDMIMVAEQVGLTTKEETTKLSEMLGDYEFKKKK